MFILFDYFKNLSEEVWTDGLFNWLTDGLFCRLKLISWSPLKTLGYGSWSCKP